jgi:hypothetical protein
MSPGMSRRSGCLVIDTKHRTMRHPIDLDYVSKAIVGIASPVVGCPSSACSKRCAVVDTDSEVAMKALKYLSFVGKIAGLVSALNVVPFVDPTVGVIVFAAASLLKDTVNRIGDLLDDGQPNQSFKG